MHTPMNRVFALFAIGLLCLLLLALPETQAQETKTPPATLTIEKLKADRTAIDKMSDIDAAIKADSLKNTDQAITHLELANRARKETNDLEKFIQQAPARLNLLRAELKKPITASGTIATRAKQMRTSKLEEQVRQDEAELASSQTNLQQWDERIATQQIVNNQAAEKLAAAGNRLMEVQAELANLSGVDQTDLLKYARMLKFTAEREKLTADIKAIELNQRNHNLLIELFTLERDVAQKAVKDSEKKLQMRLTELQNRRQQDAAKTRDAAQDAAAEFALLPANILEQFNLNIQLSNELEQATREEAELVDLYQERQSQLKDLEEEFEIAKKRVESAVLTEAIGLALRTQRLNLPAADLYRSDSDTRQIRMSDINERQINLDQMLRELTDPQAYADQIINSVDFLSDVNRQSFAIKIQESITNRIDILEKLNTVYDRIFELINDLEFTEQKLSITANTFGELLDRHLIWIRSSKPFGSADIEKLKVALIWFAKPNSWRQIVTDMGRSVRQYTTVGIILVLIGVLLIIGRGWAHRKLNKIAESIELQAEESFYLTIKALGLTIMLAAVWPFALAIPAILLIRLPQTGLFSDAIANGLIYVVRALFFMALFFIICREKGLAQIHFQWPESARKTLKINLAWAIPIVTVSSFFIGAMESVPEVDYSDALGKLAIMVYSLAISIYAARILSFKGGITSVLITKYPQSWWCRLRYIWYPLAILLPLSIFCLAMIGYYYSAVEIRLLLRDTVVLLSALFIFDCLALRLLTLARRRIAREKALLARQQQQATTDAGSGLTPKKPTEGQAAPVESIVEISDIDEHTRTLLKLVTYTIALVVLWTIWEPALPALGVLQDIHLWSVTEVINGSPQAVPVTLANIAISIVAIIVTIIAVRNLPGLLEIILLDRLPMDPGARYAYATVCRYTITAAGIIIALNSIGLQWSKLQWLVAALSVGLGFGLQEIVANFVSGLIVLFERPYRVGDTVTVGTINGTVTRIRIRATTILDFDRKELIVPNKQFITGQLINWSLSDQTIRIKIPVGIAYGSDTDLAEQLLLKVAKSNSLVKKDPQPQAIFLGFGPDSLTFELRVFIGHIDDWMPMLHAMNRSIDKEFRQAGITIAFPQRDVHLDATNPLEVRVVSDTPATKSVQQSPEAPKEPEG